MAMRPALTALITAIALPIVAQAFRPAGGSAGTVAPNGAARRVDITVAGKPFTSYIWPERVKKPVLDPIRSASGTPVPPRLAPPPPPRARPRPPHPLPP